jgi:hypothetical protein
MQVWQKLKKFLMVVALVAGLSAGYLSVNVATSCKANALICFCFNPTCTGFGDGMINALGNIELKVVAAGAAWVGILITVYFELSAEAFDMLIRNKIEATTVKVAQAIETLLWYNIRPMMQVQTEQTNVDDGIQSLATAEFDDAAEVAKTITEMEKDELDSERATRSNENGCPTATAAGGMTRANAIRQAYGRAAPVLAGSGGSSSSPPVSVLTRTGNGVGSPAANGRGADMKARLDNYHEKYCDPTANNGMSGCSAEGSAGANADLDVAGNVFNKDTIENTDADATDPAPEVVNDMIANIAEPFVKNTVPGSILVKAEGQNVLLDGESYKAKRQTIYDALYHVVARRIPGSPGPASSGDAPSKSDLINEIRSEAGLTSDMLSEKPSYNEIMKVMMVERFRSGKLSTQQIDEPENNNRELVVQQAFQAMQWNDQLDLLDKYALIVAAQVGTEALEARPFDPLYGQQSTRRQ